VVRALQPAGLLMGCLPLAKRIKELAEQPDSLSASGWGEGLGAIPSNQLTHQRRHGFSQKAVPRRIQMDAIGACTHHGIGVEEMATEIGADLSVMPGKMARLVLATLKVMSHQFGKGTKHWRCQHQNDGGLCIDSGFALLSDLDQS